MLTITTHDGATYHAEACAQTNGWRGEAIEAAIRLDVPRRSIDARISAASVMALGVRILRAQRRARLPGGTVVPGHYTWEMPREQLLARPVGAGVRS